MTEGLRGGRRRDYWRVSSVPLIYASLLVAIEAGLISTGQLLAGDILDAVVLFLLVTASVTRGLGQAPGGGAVATRGEATDRALRGLCLVPLIRIISLGLPLHRASVPLGTLSVGVLVGWAALWLWPAVGLSPAVLLSGRRPLVQLLSAAAGLALGLVAYLAGGHRLWPAGSGGGRIALAVAAAAAAAVTEELVFRGAVQVTLQRAAGRMGALAASALFAASYLDLRPAAVVLAVALAGLVFAGGVARSGTLTGALAGHLLFALGAGALWPAVLRTSRVPALHGALTTEALGAAVGAGVVFLLVGSAAARRPAKPGIDAHKRRSGR